MTSDNIADEKKVAVQHLEFNNSVDSQLPDAHLRDANGHIRPASEIWPHIDDKKLAHRLDWRLLPMVTVLYLMSFLDRANIGNAAIEGLVVDLELTGNKFNLCLTVFFFSYSFFEVPSNMILKKLRPSTWLPGIMVAWGLVMTLMGLVQSYHGLLIARIFLGVAEAGLFPGVAYYLTQWYRRGELQSRQALFYCATQIAGAFSGLLAYGIAKMNGVGGLEGWRWIFILEGIATVVVAFFAFWGMYDYPDTAGFLSDEEKAYLLHKLKYDSKEDAGLTKKKKEQHAEEDAMADIGMQAECDEQGWKFAKQALTDWHIYLIIVTYWASVIPSYALSMFMPTILSSLGFSRTKAQLLTVPGYVWGCITCVVQAKISDRVGYRSPMLLMNFAIVTIGFGCIYAINPINNPNAIYGLLYFIIVGIVSSFPGVISWNANNLSGSYKRAVGMALQISIGNLGGAISSNVYLARQAPYYKLGHGLCMGMGLMGFVSTLVLALSFMYENKQKVKNWKAGKFAHMSMEDLSRMGDRSPLFKYKL